MFKPILLNIALASCMYFGFVQGVDGAQYIAKFYVWVFMLPVSIIVLIAIVHGAEQKTPKNNGKIFDIVRQLVLMAHIGYLLTFIWYNHILTAIALMFSLAVLALHRTKVEK